MVQAFQPIIDLNKSDKVMLFGAIRNIYNNGDKETNVYRHDGTTQKGGSITNKSLSRNADLRSDSGHNVDYIRNKGVLCNCFWLRNDKLKEEVHTIIVAPDGEVAVYGQATEDSVKHVIRRILQFNSDK